ncbi:YceI family protein [Phenylobacterium sp.]|jgi:polyisoprenoid-binding protein YceI|uniref:YceI family protein n=1 Tax=Phenylobacterium sp. TaxID=1871053 RepID=UPI002F923CD3
MTRTMTLAAMAVAAACAAAATGTAQPAAPKADSAPAGVYALDPAHSTVAFRVGHVGLSAFAAGFDKVSGQLTFDPANPRAMRVEATIDVASLDLPAPPAGFHDQLMGEAWFDAKRHPQMTFRSTKVEPTGPRTARVTGDLTLRGVTKPAVLEVTYNNGYAKGQMDPAANRIGFSGRATINRSDYGMSYGVPAPGSNIGVADKVEIALETEWTKN